MKITFKAMLPVAILAALSISVCAQSASRDDILKQITAKRAELHQLETQFLSPSEEDRAAYKEFLSQPDTGLIRLLPREVYDSETYKKKPQTLTIRGGGAYYSFARLTHEYGFGDDLELQGGFLSVGFAGADYGIIAKLGDVPLEHVSFEHPTTYFMSGYEAPNEEPKARSQYRQFATGMTIDGVEYKSRAPVEVNTSYLLRSINYNTSDLLVAFRVIRQDTDGSVIIAWKLLKKYPKPVLARTDQPAN